jgi:maltose alpha-D-glucosyltransferase/alpha-amylase
MQGRIAKRETVSAGDEPLWYKDAVIYELHVRAFYDSDGDGIGDFRGLTQKLDYLEDLGINALWLLPFYPSPLRDDGYDIADYTGVNPHYGTLQDFKVFINEAHRRRIRVITELVINHTSNDHSWFQRARRSPPGSPERDFYVWRDGPEHFRDARIIFKDFETSNWAWDPVAGSYYWHRFYSHQPDLNFDNPKVQRAVLQVLDFWFGLGVDGLRLDAVPYLYQREGTNCENLPETHAFLKKLRQHVDRKFPNRMLLAEANQWPEDAVEYFGEGDECHMAFHFPVMPRMFMALQLEDRFPVVDILEQTPAIPEDCQWALFLRNHDELTLEMVTDEDRDYMYRVYAHDHQARINLGIRRRLAPLLANRRKLELMKALLFSLPGTPVLYYADEIAMGDNIYLGDRDGVRTPMQWSADRNAGFSRANPQQLYLPVIIDPEYHYEAVNVETQQKNPHSFLWWTKRLMMLRRRRPAFSRGSLEFLYPDNNKVLAFIRVHEEQRVLVVANLSRFVQYADLDLSAYAGLVPVETFGQTEFPPIGSRPYTVTLGPHSFYWFDLEAPRAGFLFDIGPETRLPLLEVEGSWTELFTEKRRGSLEEILPAFMARQRWFGGKARRVKRAGIFETVSVKFKTGSAILALVEVDYQAERTETYCVAFSFAREAGAERVQSDFPGAVLARLSVTGRRSSRKKPPENRAAEGLLYEASVDREFCTALLEAIRRGRKVKGIAGQVVASRTGRFRGLRGDDDESLVPAAGRAEQSNTSIFFGERLILKLLRRVDEGVNPDLEMSRYLTERTRFANTPPLAGSLEYVKGRSTPSTLAVLHGFVPNQGDLWQHGLDAVGRYFEMVLARRRRADPSLLWTPRFAEAPHVELPLLAQKTVGSYLAVAQLLGQRTAEMHVALAAEKEDREFVPEPFSVLYQRSLYESIRSRAVQTFQLLRKRLDHLPLPIRPMAETVSGLKNEFDRRTRQITGRPIAALRTRCHNDYHLGQVLHTGDDLIIIDFEGEPARSIGERRLKRNPLRDVASMLRSFHYVAVTGLYRGNVRARDIRFLEPWVEFWSGWVSIQFLRSYLEHAGPGGFLPESGDDLALLLDVFLLEKAAYELEYELNNRPDWLRVPLSGMLRLLAPPARESQTGETDD